MNFLTDLLNKMTRNETESPPNPPTAISPKVQTIDPKYAKYFSMIMMGVPVEYVAGRAGKDGFDYDEVFELLSGKSNSTPAKKEAVLPVLIDKNDNQQGLRPIKVLLLSL